MDYDKILAELQAIREDGERVQRHIKNAMNSLDQALQTTEELLAVEVSTVRIGPIGG